MSNVKCKKISVDCMENDVNSIRKGWPDYLGFVFYVDESSCEEIIETIKEELKKENIPLAKIHAIDYESEVRNIWNKEQIKVCIKNSSANLLREIEKASKKSNKKRR